MRKRKVRITSTVYSETKHEVYPPLLEEATTRKKIKYRRNPETNHFEFVPSQMYVSIEI